MNCLTRFSVFSIMSVTTTLLSILEPTPISAAIKSANV
jgi:hypothetical protein